MGRQRGFALVGMLVLATLLATLATAMASRQKRLILSETALAGHDRRVEAALAAETLGLILLDRDSRTAAELDHPQEALFQPHMIPIADGGAAGQAAGRIIDLQGRFNLNNLFDVRKAEARPLQMARFRRLLTTLRLDPRLAEPVLDWIDADSRPGPGRGAEDGAYLRGRTPHRTANRPFTSVEELRLIAGLTADAFDRLAPHVSALPVFTPINLNATDPEIVMSLWSGIERDAAQAVVRRAGTQPFVSPGAFVAALAAAAGTPPPEGEAAAMEGLGVTTAHVALITRIETGEGVLAMTSVLSRDGGCCRVLGRSLRVER